MSNGLGYDSIYSSFQPKQSSVQLQVPFSVFFLDNSLFCSFLVVTNASTMNVTVTCSTTYREMYPDISHYNALASLQRYQCSSPYSQSSAIIMVHDLCAIIGCNNREINRKHHFPLHLLHLALHALCDRTPWSCMWTSDCAWEGHTAHMQSLPASIFQNVLSTN